MVLTRPATRGNQLRYQVYRQPIPLAEMVLLNLEDGQKMGSFKSTFTQTAGKIPGQFTPKPSGNYCCTLFVLLKKMISPAIAGPQST